MTVELWTDFPPWMELSKYEISSMGRIENKESCYILKPSYNYSGYQTIHLIKDNGKQKNYAVHILVALAFIPNPENKPTVDHKNRIRDDNNLFNLEWATHKEQRSNQKETKRVTRKIKQSLHDGTLVRIWDSIKEIKKEPGLTRIDVFLSGAERHRLYDFKYADLDLLPGEIFREITLDSNKLMVSNLWYLTYGI